MNFIVLGQVPGTNLQINFEGALMIALVLLIAILAIYHSLIKQKASVVKIHRIPTVRFSRFAR